MNKSDKNVKELLSKGWSLKEHKFDSGKTCLSLVHPTLAPEDRGGYSEIEYALEAQERQEYKEAGKDYFYWTKDRFGGGYGYDITQLTPDGKRNFVLNIATEKRAKDACKLLNEKGNCLEEFAQSTEQYPYLLILKEKHGDRYFHVPTLASLFKTCRMIVLERIEEGYWYCDLDEEPPVTPDVPKEQIEMWKDENLKRSASEAWKRYELELKNRAIQLRQAERLKLIKENDNNKANIAAYQLLTERKGHEYEDIQFETYEEL